MEVHVFQRMILANGEGAQWAFPPEQTCDVSLDNDFGCAWGGYAGVHELSAVCVGEVQSFENTVEAAKCSTQFTMCVRIIRDRDVLQ